MNVKNIRLFLWGVIAACVAIVVYAIPRGLDITDESLYVLLAQAEPTFNISVIHTQLLFKIAVGLFGIEWGITDEIGSHSPVGLSANHHFHSGMKPMISCLPTDRNGLYFLDRESRMTNSIQWP